MPTPGSSDQAYAACVHMAVELAAPVARHIHSKAGESLLRRAAATPDTEERRLQIEAARLLAEQRDAFRAAFPALLQRELERLEHEEATRNDALSFGALELMGEEQIDETVEAVRAQQTVLSYVESDLGSLNALVSAARGRDTASASANPLRPEAWVQALRAACDQCHAPAWARARWVTHLSEMLGPELASVYRQLADTLTRGGVSAASFAVHTPRPGSRQAGAPASAQPRGGENAAGAAPVLNLRDLRRLLAGDGGAPAPRAQQPSSAAAPASDTIAPTMPWALEAVQQMTRMDEIIERVEQRLSGSGQLSARDGPLTPAQLLGQEVVRVMVDKMARDERLLPPVRDALRQLEPALLRLAGNDPRFFRDQQHPTRRFLSEMTERSLAWDTPQAAGFAQFFEPLRQAVAVLSDLRMENAEPFEYALQSLTETWDQQEARSRRERANAARALIKAERRNLLARRISERLRQREDVMAAMPQLRRFIVGPWAQVMAAAQMADASSSDDPGGYAAVVDELLASTQSGVDPQRRARLAKTVPGLVAAVRGGLASIEYPDDQTRQFLQALAQLHRSALSLTDKPVPSRPAPVAAAGPQDDEGDPSDLWLEPTEARASSLMEIAPATGPGREPQPDTAVDELRPAARAHLPLAADRLQEGTWVDLYLDGAWGRWRLSWASPQLLLFMFADGSGHYKSMTRSVLETLNRVGALRFVSAERIVDGALDAVAQTALRNSTQSSY